MWLNVYCQAQPQLNSTQPQLKLRLRLALIPPDPSTHPPGTVDSTLHDYSRQILGCFKIQDYFKCASTPH